MKLKTIEASSDRFRPFSSLAVALKKEGELSKLNAVIPFPNNYSKKKLQE